MSLRIQLLLLGLVLAPARLAADALIVTKAMTAATILEVYVERDRIRVELEIGLADTGAFRNLLPDELHEKLGYGNAPWADRLRRFTSEDLVISADGRPLLGKIVEMGARPRVQRDEINGEPMPVQDEEAETVIYATLDYPGAGPANVLTFKAPDRDSPGDAANIGFVIYHQGVAVNDFRYLSSGATLSLDWQDPWHSRFESRNLRRQYDSPLNVFLYVEPYEVRAEIIVRPLDVQQWTDIGLEGKHTITPEMYGSIQGRVAEFIGERLQLSVDAAPTEPLLDRVHFLRRSLRNSTVIDPPEELSVYSAQLGIIYLIPRTELPKEAAITWDLFSDKIQTIPGAATDEAGPLRYYLRPDDNVLRWENFLQNPTVPTLIDIDTPPGWLPRILGVAGWFGLTLLAFLLFRIGRHYFRMRQLAGRDILLGAALAAASGLMLFAGFTATMNAATSQRILNALLYNVYRSFDFRQEEAVYDMLARSVSGDLLETIYLETRNALVLESQGGARAKVNEVEVLETDTGPSGPGFRTRGTWIVAGSVGHWGHIHQRRNQYQADFTVSPVDGNWKITEMELLSEERLQ
jgi:hypothetical protein